MKKNTGFGMVYTIAALAVVAVIIVAGVLVVNHKNKTNNPNSTAANTNSQSQTSLNTTKQQTAQKYLIITEWKVKLPLSDAIADAYYVVSTSSQDSNGQPNTVWMSVKSLDPECSASRTNQGQTPPSTLTRTLPGATDPVSGKTYQQKYPNGTSLGGYYYGYLGNWSCDTNSSDQAKIQSIDNAFATAAKNIVAE